VTGGGRYIVVSQHYHVRVEVHYIVVSQHYHEWVEVLDIVVSQHYHERVEVPHVVASRCHRYIPAELLDILAPQYRLERPVVARDIAVSHYGFGLAVDIPDIAAREAEGN
jgi:hypothetical protein